MKILMNKGLVQRSASSVRIKRKRNFHKTYAKPWEFKRYEEMTLGENVQIDSMTVTKNGVTCKHLMQSIELRLMLCIELRLMLCIELRFQAKMRKSKFIHAEIDSKAKRFSEISKRAHHKNPFQNKINVMADQNL